MIDIKELRARVIDAAAEAQFLKIQEECRDMLTDSPRIWDQVGHAAKELWRKDVTSAALAATKAFLVELAEECERTAKAFHEAANKPGRSIGRAASDSGAVLAFRSVVNLLRDAERDLA